MSALVEDLQEHFREFETVTLRRLPLYRHLAGRIADDAEVAAMLLLAPPERRWTTLLLAAVHERLLDIRERTGSDPVRAAAAEPLCGWYPSTATPGAIRRVGRGPEDPWPHFRRIALEDPKVRQSIAVRGTQTNEVGRGAATLPALAGVAAETRRPSGLVEVGASAGLNLRLDDHRYRYRPDDPDAGEPVVVEPKRSRAVDAAASAEGGPSPLVEIDCSWRGPNRPPIPARPPVIGSRIGIDLEPLDLRDPDDARWLVACQWPEQIDRLERCRTAVEQSRHAPLEIMRGDLVEHIVELVADVPADQHPVVLSTWCLAYLEPDDQRAFLAELDRAGRDRDLTLLYQEQAVAVPGLDPPDRPDGVSDHRPTALCRQDWRGGRRRRAVRLADQHPHGAWLHWF